jgi:hypothetical protein
MRILVALAVVVVFAAMLVFDTAALVRLTAYCITGGCGVAPVWIGIVAGGIAVAAFLTLRRPGASVKATTPRKKASPRPARKKTGMPRISEQPKRSRQGQRQRRS